MFFFAVTRDAMDTVQKLKCRHTDHIFFIGRTEAIKMATSGAADDNFFENVDISVSVSRPKPNV